VAVVAGAAGAAGVAVIAASETIVVRRRIAAVPKKHVLTKLSTTEARRSTRGASSF
jgi:hypothetical protein